jgi:hypothetical protein
MIYEVIDINKINNADEARDLAIVWQSWQAKKAFSYEEMYVMQNNFVELADKFNLTDEFKENGII